MNTKSVLILSLLVSLSCLVIIRFGPVEVKAPNGYRVHNIDTGLNYTTIQAAIDANDTLDGHIIFVENGTYFEHIVVSKSLTLEGESIDNTIIDGNGTETVVWPVASSNITGFTIRNGEYGIQVDTHAFFSPVFTGHRLENNRIVDNCYGGVSLRGCANNTVSNNIILNNTLFGIHLWDAGNNTIINNTVMNNRHGIDFYGNSNDNVLRNNNMTDNEYNFGLILRGETRNSLGVFTGTPGIVNDVDPSNTVDGKPIYYLFNRSNEQVPSDAGYVWLNNCTNIKIDGCNLSNNLQGVLLLFTKNASIMNNSITDNVYGIYVGVFSSNNTISENTLNDNLNGIYLDDFSKFTTMRDNSISGGQMNFGVSPDIGHYVSDGSDLINDIDTSNTVNGKPIVYWMNQHNQKVPTNAGYVMLVNSTNILIQDLNLSNNVQNIFLLTSNNTIIANSSITNSIYGIDIGWFGWLDSNASIYYRFYSFNTTVNGNMLVNNAVGIRVLGSDNSTISNNTLRRNPLGILADTSNSIISRNMVIASDIQLSASYPGPDLGIFYYPEWQQERSIELASLEIGGIIVGGDYTVVYGNTVTNSSIGIFMDDLIRNIWGYRCIVFHNNLINNTRQALPAPRVPNSWDNSYPSGGNYWSDYNGTDFYGGSDRNETSSDGIGDQAFMVFLNPPQSSVIDDYPLMGPISIFDVGPWNEVNREISVISNSTISDFQLDNTEKTLDFNVTGETGFGFCRVSIPNVILQEFWGSNYSVLVNGQQIESRNWSDIENTYIYFIYNHSTQEVTIVPEFPTFLLLALFMTATLLAIIVSKKKVRINT